MSISIRENGINKHVDKIRCATNKIAKVYTNAYGENKLVYNGRPTNFDRNTLQYIQTSIMGPWNNRPYYSNATTQLPLIMDQSEYYINAKVHRSLGIETSGPVIYNTIKFYLRNNLGPHRKLNLDLSLSLLGVFNYTHILNNDTIKLYTYRGLNSPIFGRDTIVDNISYTTNIQRMGKYDLSVIDFPLASPDPHEGLCIELNFNGYLKPEGLLGADKNNPYLFTLEIPVLNYS